MAVSTFEMLPDEILMIILRHCGNIDTIFGTFSGLNQRLNNILVDRRLHLLTDFLFIRPDDPKFTCYYNSVLFNDISRQLSSFKNTDHEKHLRQCLQSLMTFHMEENWKQSNDQYELDRKSFQSIRANLNYDETFTLDQKLSEMFRCYDNFIQSTFKDSHLDCSKYTEQIESLVLTQGARLECDGLPHQQNFAYAVKGWLLRGMYASQSFNRSLLNSVLRILKILLISNPTLLQNRSKIWTTNWSTETILSVAACEFGNANHRAIYDTLSMEYSNTIRAFYQKSINIEVYLATVDLFLFSIRCVKENFLENKWRLLDSFNNILDTISSCEFFMDHKIFITTSEIATLKIILDELYVQREIVDWDEWWFDNRFSTSVERLYKDGRLDVLSLVYQYSDKLPDLCPRLFNTELLIRVMHTKEKMCLSLFRHHCSETQLKHIDLFTLLKKKECKLVKQFLIKYPVLIHRCDEEGNDPLLYVCLKVRGCRHRLVQFLIEIGCNYQRKNFNGDHFTDALRLNNNRQLMKNLIEHGIIQMDDASHRIEVMMAKCL